MVYKASGNTKSMRHSKLIKYISFLFIGLFFPVENLWAQHGGDSTGLVEKYDKGFDGIGPRVYILPPPRTAAEVLADRYSEKAYFRDSITRALALQHLTERFNFTANTAHIQYFLLPKPKDDTQWEERIQQQIDANNHYAAYGLLQSFAEEALRKGAADKALTLLHSALQSALQTHELADVAVIQNNLASIYLYKRDVEQAMLFQQAYYQETLRQKNVVEQAVALTKIAHIQAESKDFNTAENTIIRKVIPMLNRAKAYERKVAAWEVLAKIYHLQDKHTEAQWFLIQARDLARKHNLTADLAEIEYMLAFSKSAQQNFKVAQQEFLNANKLAKSEDNKLLQLAIADRLGQIYMDEDKFAEAQVALDDYLLLRLELFNL